MHGERMLFGGTNGLGVESSNERRNETGKITGRDTAFYQGGIPRFEEANTVAKVLAFPYFKDQYTAFFSKALSVPRVHRRSSHDMRKSPLLGMRLTFIRNRLIEKSWRYAQAKDSQMIHVVS